MIKCKACLNNVKKVDLRFLCTHCAFRIDCADAEASDINGIREDMRQYGVPIHNYSKSIYLNNIDNIDEVDLDLKWKDEDN